MIIRQSSMHQSQTLFDGPRLVRAIKLQLVLLHISDGSRLVRVITSVTLQ